MSSYPYTIHDGHFIIETGEQRWLLDTGSPVSVGDVPIKMGAEEFTPSSSFMGVTINALQEMVGTQFDALVGMDLLKTNSFYLNKGNKSNQNIRFDADPINFSGTTVGMQLTMGIPSLPTKIGAEDTTLFFDTGAKLTYLPARLLEGLEQAGECADFYPGIGKFTTLLYKVKIDFGAGEREVDVGILPELLETMFAVANVEGVLGNSAWEKESVCCSFAYDEIVFNAWPQLVRSSYVE
jgi:hypothetical protein